MDQVTQQNAALVEQAGAAVGSLQDQALHLTQAVGVFQLAPPSRLAAAPSATQEVSAPATPATPILALVPPAAPRLADVREHAHG